MMRHCRSRLLEAAVCFVCASSAMAADYATVVGGLNPVGYWRLGEQSGSTAVDASTQGLDGQYVGGVTLGQTGALVGDTDTAASFNGSTGYVNIPHDDVLLLDNGTINVWVNDSNGGSAEGILSKDAGYFGAGGHLTMRTDASNNVTVRLQSTTDEYSVTSTTAFQIGQWYQVTFSFGSEGMKLYIDGQQEAANAYSGGLGSSSGGAGNSEPMAVGANTWASGAGEIDPLREHYSGLLDELAIFGAQLSDEQIGELYTAGAVPEPATAALLTLGAAAMVRRRRSRRHGSP